jgi:nicotinamidase-related amidase
LQTGFQSLSSRTKSALLDLQNVSATDSADATATPSSENLLKQITDILSQLVSAIEQAKKSGEPTASTARPSSTTSATASSQSASTDNTSADTSTSDATLSASIGAEFEKWLSARQAYGSAYGNGFQLFHGSASRAAA